MDTPPTDSASQSLRVSAAAKADPYFKLPIPYRPFPNDNDPAKREVVVFGVSLRKWTGHEDDVLVTLSDDAATRYGRFNEVLSRCITFMADAEGAPIEGLKRENLARTDSPLKFVEALKEMPVACRFLLWVRLRALSFSNLYVYAAKCACKADHPRLIGNLAEVKLDLPDGVDPLSFLEPQEFTTEDGVKIVWDILRAKSEPQLMEVAKAAALVEKQNQGMELSKDEKKYLANVGGSVSSRLVMPFIVSIDGEKATIDAVRGLSGDDLEEIKVRANNSGSLDNTFTTPCGIGKCERELRHVLMPFVPSFMRRSQA